MKNYITDVPGIKVGHFTDDTNQTGCTVILCDAPTVCGVDIRGGSPGTRETALLDPTCAVKGVNAILLTGGSALGLSASDGVMRYLREQNIGYDTGVNKIPIVPTAVIFDFHLGDGKTAPNPDYGYKACLNASPDNTEQGNVGAGTGAVIGKVRGAKMAMRGGLGSASIKFSDGLVVGALAVVNAFGDVIDNKTAKIMAGARSDNNNLLNTSEYILNGNSIDCGIRSNTVLAVVATNGDFSKSETARIAQMAQTGLSNVIVPSQTMYDGDTVFALSCAKITADTNRTGIIASEILKKAVINAIKRARTTDHIPSYSDFTKNKI